MTAKQMNNRKKQTLIAMSSTVIEIAQPRVPGHCGPRLPPRGKEAVLRCGRPVTGLCPTHWVLLLNANGAMN